jgi:hypothetical protein
MCSAERLKAAVVGKDRAMLRALVKRIAGRRVGRLIPIARVIVIAEIALLAKRHLQLLSPKERRRVVELLRHPRSLSKRQRKELRALTARLEPKAFAWSAVDQVSPLPLPDRLTKTTKPPPR